MSAVLPVPGRVGAARVALAGADADREWHRLRVVARPVPVTTDVAPDLLGTSRLRLAVAVGRPLAATACFVVAASSGHTVLAALLVVVVFLTDVCIVHDLMHRSLGLSRRTNSVLIGLLALLMLDSGHALQATHQQHHRVYPGLDDPEAYLAGWPWWRVLAAGPGYRYRLWRRAWTLEPDRRRRMAVEMASHVAIVAAAVVTTVCGVVPELGLYVAVAMAGSWLFPIISVTAVHDVDEESPLRQSKTMRGRVIPRALFGMGYHLEHHLWPTIPAHHLPEAARRATALLEQHDAAITHVP